jgi:hypothetical protein
MGHSKASSCEESAVSSTKHFITERGQQPLSFESKAEKDFLCGMALFTDVRPFSTFDSTKMQRFLQALNPNYKIPSRTTIATKILDHCYTIVHQQLEKALKRIEYLNICIDETTNIQLNRIINLSITNGERSYYWCSKDIGKTSITVSATADWVTETIRFVYK